EWLTMIARASGAIAGGPRLTANTTAMPSVTTRWCATRTTKPRATRSTRSYSLPEIQVRAVALVVPPGQLRTLFPLAQLKTCTRSEERMDVVSAILEQTAQMTLSLFPAAAHVTTDARNLRSS